MITSFIKTNLILKEIGVTRYSLRSNKEKTNDKEIHIYQKGNILTLLDIGFDDLPKDEAALLKAIVGAINPNESNELIEAIKFDSSSHVQEMIASKKTFEPNVIINSNSSTDTFFFVVTKFPIFLLSITF